MPRIVIYSTPTCVYCKMAKAFFQKHNVVYEEKDVAHDHQALEEMINKSHQLGTPVIEVDGEIVVGFDQTKLAQLIGVH
jgi:glutaredoxin 3